MKWAFPAYLHLLWTLPLLIFAIYRLKVKAGKVQQIWFTPSLSLRWKFWLRAGSALFLVLAIAGPYFGRSEQNVDIMGRDIYFLVDISGSMNAQDIKPSRLDKVKIELKSVVEQMKGDRMGIIVFTSSAYVMCPMTNDYHILKQYIDLISTEQFSNSGTDIRAAMLQALDRFANKEVDQRQITRSVVLITDGEDFGDGYASVISRMDERAIKVFPVGVGTPEGAQVPILTNGKITGYKKDAEGKTAISTLNKEKLADIANKCGTNLVLLDQSSATLSPLVEDIRMQASAIVDEKMEMVANNRYQWFLFPAFFALVVSLFWMPVTTRPARGGAA